MDFTVCWSYFSSEALTTFVLLSYCSLFACFSLSLSFSLSFLSIALGCSEMLMANAVQQLAARTPGKEAMAMESFAKALRQVCLP